VFNIGPPELIVIFLVALLVVGPKRLPQMGRSIGQGLRELRKATSEFRSSIDDESEDGGTIEDDPTDAGGDSEPARAE
jgi:sec-independent protein translocase protein TatA